MDFIFSIDVPDIPVDLEVTNVTKNSAELLWNPPMDDGGSPITNYIVEMKDKFGVRWTTIGKPTKTSFKVTNLRTGSEYEFQVRAENKAGVGEPSQATKPIVAKDAYGKLTFLTDLMMLILGFIFRCHCPY